MHHQHDPEGKAFHLNFPTDTKSMSETKTNSTFLHKTKHEKVIKDVSETKLYCESSFNDINDLEAVDSSNKNIIDTQMDDMTKGRQDATDKNNYPKDTFIYTNEMRVENSLLKLLFEINVPNYAFKKIMDWAYDA